MDQFNSILDKAEERIKSWWNHSEQSTRNRIKNTAEKIEDKVYREKVLCTFNWSPRIMGERKDRGKI